ncbi:MAG: hypothetical protein ABJF90_00295, partial [Lentilitoribacter sp.]
GVLSYQVPGRHGIPTGLYVYLEYVGCIDTAARSCPLFVGAESESDDKLKLPVYIGFVSKG